MSWAISDTSGVTLLELFYLLLFYFYFIQYGSLYEYEKNRHCLMVFSASAAAAASASAASAAAVYLTLSSISLQLVARTMQNLFVSVPVWCRKAERAFLVSSLMPSAAVTAPLPCLKKASASSIKRIKP